MYFSIITCALVKYYLLFVIFNMLLIPTHLAGRFRYIHQQKKTYQCAGCRGVKKLPEDVNVDKKIAREISPVHFKIFNVTKYVRKCK